MTQIEISKYLDIPFATLNDWKQGNSNRNKLYELLSKEDWNVIEETLFLNSIPNLATSIKKSMQANDSEFSEDIEW